MGLKVIERRKNMKTYVVFFRENNEDMKTTVKATDKYAAMVSVLKNFPGIQLRRAKLLSSL